ncbi:MAG: AMP-binding protein [Deltaproteobacteria bacterium]|nr:AMP-binding protein [Deltaproteobacteria bacterium]
MNVPVLRWEGYYDEPQETMRPERRWELHRELLRETVRHAYENAPATRRKMEEAGVRPEDVKDVADLEKIPLTRKADLKHIQKGKPPFGGLAAVPPAGMRRIYVSPGPTYDPEGRGQTHWRWEKAFFAAGFRGGDIVQNTFSYHLSPAGLMFEEALLKIGCTVIPAGVGNTELQAQVMKELSVTGYVGTPSFLLTLLEKARESGYLGRDGIGLQVALVAGEMLPETLRSRLRDEFGVQVRQAYGTADVGALGYECREASGMHVPDEILLELLDPVTGAPVPQGSIGEVVVTLPDRTYPLVRFATGDLSLLSFDPCPCGRTSPRLLKIAGRVDQVTKVKGMFVHPEQVSQIEGKIGEIGSAQIVVSRSGHEDRMEIRVVLVEGIEPSDRLTARIVEEARGITRLGGVVRYVSGGEIEEGGKKIVDRRKWD